MVEETDRQSDLRALTNSDTILTGGDHGGRKTNCPATLVYRSLGCG